MLFRQPVFLGRLGY